MENILKLFDFGNEAGDDADIEELMPYFVEKSSYSTFVKPDYKLLIATAKKGVGKSALATWTATKIDDESLVISCKGNDLVRSNFGLITALNTPNDYIRDWKVRLCTLVNRRLAEEIDFAWTDDSMTLVEAAEIDGFRSKNLISALIGRMKKMLPKFQTEKSVPKNEVELLKRFKGQEAVWLIVDDLDATYQRTTLENLELCSFFSACRELIKIFPNLRIRVTLRTDVWPVLRRFDESLDKVEQYVEEIKWSQPDFRRLLSRRVEAFCGAKKIKLPGFPERYSQEEKEEALINMVFEKRMKWGGDGDEQRSYKIIYTISYQRPRWAIQLSKLAQLNANSESAKLINMSHIDAVWSKYGKMRIDDLVVEHKHQCSCIEELLSGFRGASRRLNREELLSWIKNKISNHITPVIDGKVSKQPIEIAHFLFRIGFIVARTDESIDFEHYHFEEMPDFLTSRTNADFGVIWEIHPCYREALDIKGLNKYKRLDRSQSKGSKK